MNNVNNENLNTLLKKIRWQEFEELLNELTSKIKKADLLQKINKQPFAIQPFAVKDSYFIEFSKIPKIKRIETKAEYTKK